MPINEQAPLLPRTHPIFSRRKWKDVNEWRATVFVVCVCIGMLGIWGWSSAIGKCGHSENAHQGEGTNKLTANGSLNYLVVGDWGRQGHYNQSLVAVQMGTIGQQLGIEFVISTGDNFYDKGLTSSDDPAFTASFTDVYTAPSLQTTWYSVLGNHDYMGDVLAELSDELVERDQRWFCRRAFELKQTLCSGSDTGTCTASVDMFFFDTTPFIDDYWSPNVTRTFDWRNLAPRAEQLQSQLQDLRKSLNSSTATWKIVFAHHTIRSIGHHGDLVELVEQLLPILEEHEVDLYINGHDHNLQHIKRADSSVHLFTSGGGSKAYSGLRPYTDAMGVQFAYDGQGFLAVSMRPESVSLTFHDLFGEAIYNHVLLKGRSQKAPAE